MKSVGEVMAIGRTFQESLQKALRGLETGLTGLDEIEIEGLGQSDDKNAVRAALGTPTPDRLLQVAQAMRLGWSNEEIFTSCKIDPWFLAEMRGIVDMESKVKRARPAGQRRIACARSKRWASPTPASRCLPATTEAEVKAARRALDVRPVFKRIDTCAAEFASPTAYMYSTYEAPFAGADGGRERAVRQEQGHHPRRRPEPDRPGHRVRLLLLPCLLRAARRRLRNHHDQLQSGDGVDRLRHRGPPLLRAADRRRRAGDHRHRTHATARCTA